MSHPPRFFVDAPLSPASTIELDIDIVRHIQVLRLAAGDVITVFNGQGGEYRSTLIDIQKKSATIHLDEFKAVTLEPPYSLTLAQGIAGGDKMDWIIEKAVELGVTNFQPLQMEKCVVRLSAERAEKRLSHWRAIVQAASEQCGRNRFMNILPVHNYSHWLAGATQSAEQTQPLAAQRILLSPRGTLKIDDCLLNGHAQHVILLIGPEGGLTQAEEAAAFAAGWQGLSLGPRILRTETAGMAIVAALHARWGGF